jgi:acetyl esterase/lipase
MQITPAAGKDWSAGKSARTCTYKTVDGHAIQADVYGGAQSGSRKPVLVTIHGGALIMGGRQSVRKELLDLLLEEGFVIVSIDYRLAPETKLPAIIEDLRDACRWVRSKGPALFGADPERLAVHGESAGGYLTLMAGCCVEPRPKALASYYGYGDIIGEWYSKPDPGYCREPRVSRERALSVVGNTVVSGYPQSRDRSDFYLYCRQNGLWPREVAGFDPTAEPEAFKPFCPVQNVTASYPPTLLCHGTKDADVPYEQSVQMAAALAENGVTHEFISFQGAGHGFCGATPREVRRAVERTVGFLVHYAKRDSGP